MIQVKFLCECGNRIYDTTDYISYKAHLIPDQDLFDYLDQIDNIIENVGPTQKDKEDAKMKVSIISNDYSKTIYQCQKCGNIFFEDKLGKLEIFKSCDDEINRKLLQSVKGDKWQGFLYAEWIDNKPVWLEKNGYISAPTLITGQEYDEWEVLETQYYITFNELKEKDILRSSSLKKNKITIHSWILGSEEPN